MIVINMFVFSLYTHDLLNKKGEKSMKKILMETKAKTTESSRQGYLEEVHIKISLNTSTREFCKKEDAEKEKWRRNLVSLISFHINEHSGMCSIELNIGSVYPYETMKEDIKTELNKRLIRVEEPVVISDSGERPDYIKFYYKAFTE